MGGYNNRINSSNQHIAYDGKEWRSVGTLPINCNGASAVVYNNEIHLMGGYNIDDGYLDQHIVYKLKSQ